MREENMDFCMGKEIVCLSCEEEGYPKEWKFLSDKPPKVYCVGNVRLLKERKLTVVGSRRTPPGTMRLGAQISKDLSTDFVMVTGTADGGDSAVIEGALAGSGEVICVLAGGFSSLSQTSYLTLQKVAEKGLLISPYPMETGVRAFSYEYRNKLLASLGEGTFVLSADQKSGALITAKWAKEFEKTVFALPYFPGVAAGAGCNALLKDGGVLVEDATDIFKYFGVERKEKKRAVSLSEEERKLYEALQNVTDAHVSDLAAQSGVPPYKARAVLSALEVKGLAVALGGNRYAPLSK